MVYTYIEQNIGLKFHVFIVPPAYVTVHRPQHMSAIYFTCKLLTECQLRKRTISVF